MFVKKFLAVSILAAVCLGDMSFKMPANITALKASNNGIFVGLDDGQLGVFNKGQFSALITLPKISNHFGKDQNSRIYQISELNGQIAAISEADELGKNVILIINAKTKIIPSPIAMLKQVLFLDENTLLLIGPNCEINYYDIKSEKITHTSKFTISGFEKAVFSTDRKSLLLACEGGIVFYYDLGAKKLSKEEALHKDRIYDIAVYENRLLTGTPERKARYFDGAKETWYDTRFPVYKVALNSDIGAFSKEKSIVIIDKNGKEIKEIPYTGTLLTDLEFLPNGELVGAGYDNNLYFWEAK